MKRADPYNAQCPSRAVLELIGSKWSMLLLALLRHGPMRPATLKRRIGGISQKMLTQTLRGLQHYGLVERIDHSQIPLHVEYRLTRLGHSLAELVTQIDDWVARNYSRMAAPTA